MKLANENLERETITGHDPQTIITDPGITGETDLMNSTPEDDDEEDQEEDYGLNHDEEDDLSLNIENDEEDY